MNANEIDSINKFYENSEIFITGGSGYIGKVLIEKLLRSCTRVKKIYLLLRPKKGRSLEERVKEIWDSMVRHHRLLPKKSNASEESFNYSCLTRYVNKTLSPLRSSRRSPVIFRVWIWALATQIGRSSRHAR